MADKNSKEPNKSNFLRFVKRTISTNRPAAEEVKPPDEVQLRKASPTPMSGSLGEINRIKSKPVPSSLRIRPKTTMPSAKEVVHKRSSLGAIQELIQCPLCVEKLVNPKMLPCQHTFCLVCLYTQIEDDALKCPICLKVYPEISSEYLTTLPTNLYIDNLLRALMTPSIESNPKFTFMAKVDEKQCRQCQTMITLNKENYCQHCKQNFCGVCWESHISELKLQIGSLAEQLKSGSHRLNLRLENYKDKNDWLINQIKTNIENKIFEIQEHQEKLLKEAMDILKEGEDSAQKLNEQLKIMEKTVIDCVSKDFDIISNDNEKVNKFMQFHRKAIDLLSDVGHWGEIKYSFDTEKLCIEVDFQQPADADTDEQPIIEVKGIQNPLESVETMVQYYRSRNFTPRMIWKKCPRPAGVGVSPWSDNIYICSTDAHNIIVMDKNKGKIITRYSDPKILCPQGIAFSQKREEIYITDKWAHCIHVLSKTGIYLRTIGVKGVKEGCLRSPEGIAVEPNENHLYVCDTGNDRVQAFDIATGKFFKFIGVYNRAGNKAGPHYTQLMGPTDIAAVMDRLVIADSGNRRIKIYSYSGEKLKEFGSHGHHKGQFQHPETLAVDPLGFILVGDSGNARIQIFDPTGHLLRVFGGKGKDPGKFGWVSGICITPQLEIIVCDTKNHQINVY